LRELLPRLRGVGYTVTPEPKSKGLGGRWQSRWAQVMQKCWGLSCRVGQGEGTRKNNTRMLGTSKRAMRKTHWKELMV
jgi:hypothetical protein